MTFDDILKKYSNLRIGFVGVGVSNTPIIKLFAENKIDVTVRDLKQLDNALYDELYALGCKILTGDSYLANIDEDMLFLSPAIKLLPELLASQNRGVVLTGELPEFFSFCNCKTICITGSDGKTTTTTLTAKILEAEGKKVHLGGNIGKNLFMELPNITPDDFVVAEVSSFQLMKLHFSPDVAVVTNVSPNHLDWHTDMDEYVEAKIRIFKFQKKNSVLVLNYDNDITRDFVKEAPGKTVFFSRFNIKADYFYDGRYIVKNGRQILDCKDMLLPGLYNRENLMAAIAATEMYAKPASASVVANSFPGVEHRCEFVREIGGVRYYNSTIDSSPTRTKAAIESFSQPLVVIAGGYDKNIPVEILGDVFKKHVHTAILMGHTANKLEKMLTDCDYNGTVIKVSDMESAVKAAHEAAKAGDCVILSPAASSFDLFKNFAERGNIYKNAVNALKG